MKTNDNRRILNEKEKMKKRLWGISTLCTLKLIYIFQLAGLFIMFIPQAAYYGDPRTAYAIVLIAAYPVVLSFLSNKSRTAHASQKEEEILPVLSSRCKYSKTNYTVWTRSFLLQTMTLLLYQYSNTLVPYDNPLLQYGPALLIIFSLFLRLLTPILFRWRLHRSLLGGI